MLFRPGEYEAVNKDRELLIRLIASLEHRGLGPLEHEYWTVPEEIVAEIEAHLNKARGQA